MLNFSCNVRSIEYEDLRRHTIIIDCHYIQQIAYLQFYLFSCDLLGVHKHFPSSYIITIEGIMLDCVTSTIIVSLQHI